MNSCWVWKLGCFDLKASARCLTIDSDQKLISQDVPYISTASTAHIICILVTHLAPPMYFLIAFFCRRNFSAESNIPEITSEMQSVDYFQK